MAKGSAAHAGNHCPSNRTGLITTRKSGSDEAEAPVARWDREVALLFFAHRRMAGVADAVMARHGLGRAHHRVLFFVGQRPGLTVRELLCILGITNQSLHRVMAVLLTGGLLRQTSSEQDGRLRRLHLTAAGSALEQSCAVLQAQVLTEAAQGSGPGASFAEMLAALMSDADRALFATLSPAASAGGDQPPEKAGARLPRKARKPSA